MHAALLLLPAVACGHGLGCLADPAVVAFLVLATMLYGADAIKDLRNGAEPSACDTAAEANGQDMAHRLALLTGLALLATFWIALAARLGRASPSLGWQQAAGAAAMLAGVILRGLAVRRLGRFFVSSIRIVPEQPLVCDGIYRILRHPSETGILAASLGASVLLDSWVATLVSVAVIFPLVAVRVRAEDRFLRRAFGIHYAQYQSRTGGLLPRLPGPKW